MYGVRWIMCGMIFLGCICNFMLRINIDFAIVQMIVSNTTETSSTVTQYAWTPQEKSWILGSFFYGYILLQIPGGRLAERYGTKPVLGWSMFMAALISMSIPLLASLSPWAVVLARILQGLVSSPTFPSLSPFTIKWTPRNERAKFVSISQSGGTIGPVITYPLCGIIMDAFGWDKVFYTTATIALVWCILWYLLVTDDPKNHRWICAEEVELIQEGRKGQQTLLELNASAQNEKVEPPLWDLVYRIFRTPSVWVTMSCDFAYCWGLYAILVLGPTFIDEVIVEDGANKFTKNALLTVMPFIATSICCQAFGIVSDLILTKKMLTPLNNQKLFVTCTMIPPAIGVLLMGYNTGDPIVAIVWITIGFAFNGALGAGHIQNILIQAPNRAGTLMGISNGFGNVSGALTPLLCTYLVYNSGLDAVVGWRLFFASATVFYVLAWLAFILFATDRQQDFDTYYTDIRGKSKENEEMEILPVKV